MGEYVLEYGKRQCGQDLHVQGLQLAPELGIALPEPADGYEIERPLDGNDEAGAAGREAQQGVLRPLVERDDGLHDAHGRVDQAEVAVPAVDGLPGRRQDHVVLHLGLPDGQPDVVGQVVGDLVELVFETGEVAGYAQLDALEGLDGLCLRPQHMPGAALPVGLARHEAGEVAGGAQRRGRAHDAQAVGKVARGGSVSAGRDIAAGGGGGNGVGRACGESAARAVGERQGCDVDGRDGRRRPGLGGRYLHRAVARRLSAGRERRRRRRRGRERGRGRGPRPGRGGRARGGSRRGGAATVACSVRFPSHRAHSASPADSRMVRGCSETRLPRVGLCGSYVSNYSIPAAEQRVQWSVGGSHAKSLGGMTAVVLWTEWMDRALDLGHWMGADKNQDWQGKVESSRVESSREARAGWGPGSCLSLADPLRAGVEQRAQAHQSR